MIALSVFFLLFGITLGVFSIIYFSVGMGGGGLFLLIISIVTIALSIRGINKIRDERDKKEQLKLRVNEINSEASKKRNEFTGVNFLATKFHSGLNVLIAISMNKLIIMPNNNNETGNNSELINDRMFCIKIPIQDIKYYLQTGEIVTKIKGDGGNSSYSIISGFNGKINPISISTSIINTKQTQLFYVNENKDEMIAFEYEAFHKLKQILPDYDYNYVNLAKIIKEQNNNHTTIEEKLHTLVNLKNSNLISEKEYEEKRKSIIETL